MEAPELRILVIEKGRNMYGKRVTARDDSWKREKTADKRM